MAFTWTYKSDIPVWANSSQGHPYLARVAQIGTTIPSYDIFVEELIELQNNLDNVDTLIRCNSHITNPQVCTATLSAYNTSLYATRYNSYLTSRYATQCGCKYTTYRGNVENAKCTYKYTPYCSDVSGRDYCYEYYASYHISLYSSTYATHNGTVESTPNTTVNATYYAGYGS